MTGQLDSHAEISRLQKQIENYIDNDKTELVFDFKSLDGKIQLDLITVNPFHRQSFLFNSVIGVDKFDALKKMMEYVISHREKENTYTIQWVDKSATDDLQTSYFRSKNMYEALDKFYYGRDINSINIFSITLNPLS